MGFPKGSPGLGLDSNLTLTILDQPDVDQPDGSLLTTRIKVEDPSAMNQWSGALMFVDNVVPALTLYGRSEPGSPVTDIAGKSGLYFDTPYFDFASAVFKMSGHFTDLQNLPFVPSFNDSTMVAGQNVDNTSGNFLITAGTYTTANTITLIPQTINGMVVASQQSGSFTNYPVSLAACDLFPTLAVQQGQTTPAEQPQYNRGLCRQQYPEVEHPDACPRQHTALLRSGVQR